MLIQTLLRWDKRHADAVPRAATCWAPNKPSIDFRGVPTFAEFVIVRLLEEDGWEARWIKHWLGRREFCSDVGKPSPLPPDAAATFEAIHRRAPALRGAGSWDVFAWRGGEYLFVESKQHRSTDRLNDNQLAWLEAALEVGMSAQAFAIVEYDAGPTDRPRAREAPSTQRQRMRPLAVTSNVQPTRAQVEEARDGVASRGWATSKAARHNYYPVGIREPDGAWRPCEHCRARRNPARWPLFFRTGPLAGALLWCCSTCKVSQADSRGVAVVLADTPAR